MRKLLMAVSTATLLTLAGVGTVSAAGGSGGISQGAAFYANGHAYRTVATPTDISGTGAPEQSFDIIYAFPAGTQMNVAEAAPGDTDYNGGRWMVTPISFTNYAAAAMAFGGQNGVFDSDAEVQAALDAGVATLSAPVRYFICPVIPFPRNGM